MLSVVKQAGQGLPGRTPVHAVLYAASQSCDQRRAFYQPLGINNRIVLLCLYGIAKGFTFSFDGRGKPGLTPTANSDGNHAIDSIVPGWNLRESFFYHPIKLNTRDDLLCVSQCGQCV